jgi:hypothetical protein
VKLQGSVDSSAETITTLERTVAMGVEDYDLLMEGNKSLLAECDVLHERSENLDFELMKARASAAEDIAALEARVKSAEARIMDVTAAGKKCLSDF